MATLRILLTGGGTGGHVSPILAVVEELHRRSLRFDALWLGSKSGAERAAAGNLGIPYHAVAVGKLRRYLSLHTVPDAARVPLGIAQSIQILRRFRPHVIFSTGGYVGVPAVVAGRMLGIPALTHEQTATLGLATRINARFSNCVALSHEHTRRPKVRSGGRVTVTGNPIRSALRDGDQARGRSTFSIVSDLPLLYVTGGAQGALGINDVVGAVLPELLESVEIVHQTGPNDFNGSFAHLHQLWEELQPDQAAKYHLTELIGDELADLYAAASIVLGRSGAGTVAELASLGLPSILVPLPGADEQRENARILEAAGAAIVIDQDELSPDRLVQEIRILADDEQLRSTMATAARSTVGSGNPAGRIVDELLELASRNRSSSR
jgi:UDP-N-acetylglucosamine--N-acetylmuramyl-(pentapeptide) pyrophosphoryl-undecaprenol N-acetylglucosamine transferase